ncbi:PH domain-containing protein [Lichenifustis flavocetrariae]|uniref:PH domain-containing protein n=1 Tax=Lichenifustis flavocetrariae TaxID=2949735 RepID=A0AA42CLQ2_9HYPH|nr:PH domain-containing protein [Lichenifustis flavocetrariae]MCW6510666.1 PH domain-containing protein [Lichenifustis flavocetrariae]
MASGDAKSPSFAHYLLRGEEVVWWGRPRQGLLLTPRDALLIPFSLLWGGFAIFWETMVLRTEAPGFMALWGLPFVLVGLFLIFGRFFLDSWLRARIYYAVTKQRILIARSGPWPSFKALHLDRLPEVTLNEERAGRGTIRFGSSTRGWNSWNGRAGAGEWIAALDSRPQFLSIADAKRVFGIIQHLTAGASLSETLDPR